MLLAGQITEAVYGRITPWEKDSNAFDLMGEGTGIQPEGEVGAGKSVF